MSSSQTSRIHSFHKELNTYYVPSAQRAGVCCGLDHRGSINPFPGAPFFRRGHTCRQLLPSPGPSRKDPRLTRTCLHYRLRTDHGWMERWTWRGLLSTGQTAALQSPNLGRRRCCDVATDRKTWAV